VLLTARVLQGASAALLAPAALALLTQLFPDAKDRTKALGIWGGIAGIGAAAGVLLGGVLTTGLGWPSVFFVNVPVGLVVLAALPLLITRDAGAAPSKFDLRGLVRNRNVTVGNVVVLLVGAAMVALFFALSVYMQSVLGYGSLSAGLGSLPLAGVLIVSAATAPAIVARLGLKGTLVASLLVLAAGLVWLAAAPADAAFVVNLLGPSLLIGIGIGGALVTATQLSVDGVDAAEAGLAGGLVNTSQQLGGAVGLAVLSTIAAARTGALEAAGIPAPDALTSGFSWVFLGAALLAVLAAGVAGAAARR
jgi:MFS family permease